LFIDEGFGTLDNQHPGNSYFHIGTLHAKVNGLVLSLHFENLERTNPCHKTGLKKNNGVSSMIE